jgi:hypothetical protein
MFGSTRLCKTFTDVTHLKLMFLHLGFTKISQSGNVKIKADFPQKKL